MKINNNALLFIFIIVIVIVILAYKIMNHGQNLNIVLNDIYYHF